jgi:phytoene dehydrogenase-like protein
VTRVLVIGAGHNGLMAAIHLAAAGLDVTVLEQASHPGGASSSAELTLPGFVHDPHAAFGPMAAASPAMQELELERDGVEWIDPPAIVAHPFEDGTSIALYRDVERTAASLGPSGAAWAAAMRQWLPLARPFAESVLSPLPPPLRHQFTLAARLRTDGIEWGRRMLGSVQALGLDLFDGDERATAWLAGSAQHSGLPPSTTVSGAFGFLLQLAGHRYGWPLPRGGMGSLATALAGRAERAGARVRCDATVEEILVRGRRVAGVRLAGDEDVPADAVVSTVTAGLLARLLPPGALPGRLHRRLRVWRYGTAPFKIDYAVSAPAPWAAEEPRHTAVVHVAGSLRELNAAAQAGQRGEVPERPALVVGQQSLLDPTRAPDGQHTLYVYGHVPSRYDLDDDEVAARIEAQLERFAPGFGSTVLARCVQPPWRNERDNPSLVGGDLGGGSYELDQQLVFRPSPELARYRAPLRGLYVAGASTHPGGAIHGMSGRGAAHALLRDRRLRPWRRV